MARTYGKQRRPKRSARAHGPKPAKKNPPRKKSKTMRQPRAGGGGY